MQVLVVEDEEAVRDLISMALSRDGFMVETAKDTREARVLLKTSTPAVIILDWMMPGESGISFCKELRASPFYNEIPIIMLSAKAQEEDVLNGFSQGVDDYLKKPFSIKELRARVRALIKRSYRVNDNGQVHYGPFLLETEHQHVVAKDCVLKLSPIEYRVMIEMLQNPGRIYSRSLLLDRVWGLNSEVEERTVDATMRRIRKVLKKQELDEWVETVWGSGYRMKALDK